MKLVRQRQISYDIAYMWNLKQWYKWTSLQNRNRLTDRKQTYGYWKGNGGRDKLGVWDEHIYTKYKMDKQQGLTV